MWGFCWWRQFSTQPSGRREFKPSIFGKANTMAQVSAVAAVLLHQLTNASWVVIFRMLALDATIVLTVVSGLHYAWAVSRRGNSQALQRLRRKVKRVQRAVLCVVGDVLCFSGFFDLHVAEFFGVKDLATLQAFDKFGVFVPGDDSYLWDVCRRLPSLVCIGWNRYSFRQIVAIFSPN